MTQRVVTRWALLTNAAAHGAFPDEDAAPGGRSRRFVVRRGGSARRRRGPGSVFAAGATWWLVTFDWADPTVDQVRGVIADGPWRDVTVG
ncbi:MAG TPA: hypothetical protein VGJ44_08615 [Kribbellaceae bacterium]